MARNIAVPCKKPHFQAAAGAMKRQTVPHVHDVTSLLQRCTTFALLFRRNDVMTYGMGYRHFLLIKPGTAFSVEKEENVQD